MRQAICCLYFPLRILIVIFLSPILTLVYWLLFFPLILPSHLFRYLLSIIVRSLDPDVCKIVDRFSHIPSRDFADWTTKPSHSITMIFKLSNTLTLEEARQLALDKIVNKRTRVNNCQLEYPELQQYWTKRLGFLFFKWDRNFKIENHVNLYSSLGKKDQFTDILGYPEMDIVNENKLMRIWEYMMSKPYAKKQSPWEWFLIPDYQQMEEKGGTLSEEKQCVCIFRVHHGLCDGASIYKLLLALTDNGEQNLAKDIIAFQKAPKGMDLLLNLKGFFCGPTAITNRLSKGLDFYNPLHPPLGKKTGKLHIVKTSLDLETVKNIRHAHLDVSIHSVLIAALTGAIRNFLLANGYSIPLSPIRLGMPIPKPGHSLKLRNEYLISMIDLPVEKKSPRQRLFACEKRLNSLKSESVMPFLVQMFKLFGGLPSKLVRLISLKSSFTVLYSEIKGPGNKLTVLDGKHDLVELIYSFGLGTDDLGTLK